MLVALEQMQSVAEGACACEGLTRVPVIPESSATEHPSNFRARIEAFTGTCSLQPSYRFDVWLGFVMRLACLVPTWCVAPYICVTRSVR